MNEKVIQSSDYQLWKMPPLNEANKLLLPALKTYSEKNKLHEDELNQLREQAKQEGFQQGMKQAEGQIAEKMQQLSKFEQKLSGLCAQYDNSLAEKVFEIVAELVKKIIFLEIDDKKETIIHILEQLLAQFPNSKKKLSIKLNQDDLTLLQVYQKDLTTEHRIIDFIAVDDLSRGSFVIEDDNNVLNANLEEILEKHIAVLKSAS